MNIDERLESITRNLDMLTKIHLDNDREYRERFDQFQVDMRRLANAQRRNARDLRVLSRLLQQDGENIRALARIAERHEGA